MASFPQKQTTTLTKKYHKNKKKKPYQPTTQNQKQNKKPTATTDRKVLRNEKIYAPFHTLIIAHNMKKVEINFKVSFICLRDTF